ncbi:MAG: hypothetical protein VXZ72_02950 [Chlamydiota bacterium]|nr:hypothetical protein [Chlamydiota bacterium]
MVIKGSDHIHDALTKLADVEKVLKQNKDVPFVKRIQDPKSYPTKRVRGGKATHQMASAEVDGKEIAYPTLRHKETKGLGKILRPKGKLYRDSDPITAVRSGNYIEFPTAAKADEFARGSWKKSKSWNK